MSKRDHVNDDIDEGSSTNQKKIKKSNQRRRELQNVFIAYDMEEQMKKKVEKKEKKLSRQLTQQELLSQADETANKVVENDSIFIDDLEESIGTVIKNAAIRKHPIYHLLDSNQQSVVCLGLNSIIDLSAQYPERQTTLFNKKQWKDITNKCPSYTFNDTLYRGVDEAANSVFDLYNPKQSATRNWNLMYQQVISLKGQYNAELNDSFRDIDFCLYFYESLFMLQKHYEYLFTDDIDNSEWDMIVKFWGPVMERLFTGTGLRLKWDDTILTMDDVTTVGHFKVDMRVINDTKIQKLNSEEDLAVAEAAKSDPGVLKYQSDRCKLLSESKVIIDNFVAKGRDVNSVYSIQFCGFEMMIISLSLFSNGLYVGNEVHHVQIDDRLQKCCNYLSTVKQLLCFRDETIEFLHKSDDVKLDLAANRASVKGAKYNAASEEKKAELVKSDWTRGTWVPPRRKESAPAPIPSNLVSR